MAHRRAKTGRLRTAEQLRVAGSAVALEIIESLRAAGPATAADLGPRLGRKPNALHYHIRKLRRLGLIRGVETRLSGVRTETVYDVTAETFEGESAPRDPTLRRATDEVVAALLRLAARNFARASRTAKPPVTRGKYRSLLADRRKAWLTRRELAEVNHHLDAVKEIFTRRQGRRGGQLCELTVVVTPVDQRRRPS